MSASWVSASGPTRTRRRPPMPPLVNVAKRVSPTGKLPASHGDEEHEKAYILAGRHARENGTTLTAAQARVHAKLGCTTSKTAVSQSVRVLFAINSRNSTQIGRMHMVRPCEGTSLA